jgi:hypothetical protein
MRGRVLYVRVSHVRLANGPTNESSVPSRVSRVSCSVPKIGPARGFDE